MHLSLPKRRDSERPMAVVVSATPFATRTARSVRITVVSIVLALAAVALMPLCANAEPFFTAEELERNPKLTPALRRLILAYENYLDLYPNGEHAKTFIIGEAGYFRDAGDEQTAISLYERVLDRDDLKQSDRAYAFEQIMASCRDIGAFTKQEQWAHKMAVADVGPEKQQAAKDFIFQAGYNRAKAAEDSAVYDEAARAYERLAVRNPDHSQAPIAMLKAAKMWEDAQEMNRAALTYERFYYTYPDYRDESGKGALVALVNAAAIYAEQDDYRHTADAVERILAAAPGHPDRKKYLNNLASIYALLKDYNNAIRVRQEFIVSYPEDTKSGSYQWDITEYRGIVGQSEQQLAEYEAFIRNYPADWRAIEANYRIGMDRMSNQERALERGRDSEAVRMLGTARVSFERAVALHDSLVEPHDGEGGDLAHTIKSLSHVAAMDSANYYKIEIASTSNFSADSALKWETLQTASKTYLKMANYGYPPTMFQALFQRGQMLEDFAYQYLTQPRPDSAVTYDEILRVFSINSTSQTILRQVAMPAYDGQMLGFYEQNSAQIDTSAQEVEDEDLREVHLYWLERARERMADIPAIVDSLELNTIEYEADLLVLDAQQKIPERFESAWQRFAEEKAERYRENPRVLYGDKQLVFNLGVSPLVYGAPRDTVIDGIATTIPDTNAMVPRFMQIIDKGGQIGEEWQLYNRGRLRLVYAAKSTYFKQVADDAVDDGLHGQVNALYGQSQILFDIIENLPELDLSSLGDPPGRPDLTPPDAPVRPEGEPKTWGREVTLKFIADFKQYKEDVAGITTSVRRFQRRLERYKERRKALIEQQTETFKGVLEQARGQAQLFGQAAMATQLYRISVESVLENTVQAYGNDVAFGNSVGYSDIDILSVRDSALTYGMSAAEKVDSLYRQLFEVRQQYTSTRDNNTGGEGTPAFQVANNLVTGYAAVADSFRMAAIRRYLDVFEGRDSVYAVGLENPIIQRAIERLRQLDPTFGVTTVPMTFTFVTEDSTGLWKATSYNDPNNPDTWRDMELDVSNWVPAVNGSLDWRLSDPGETPVDPDAYQPFDQVSTDTTESFTTDSSGFATTPVTDFGAPTEPSVAPPLFGFPEMGNLNLTDIWTPDPADTVFLRRNITIPPRWDELPDSLRTGEAPRPVIEKARITVTADDDYRVYLNGQVTNARDQSAGIDWDNAKSVEILTDQFFIGDTANVLAIQAINETRLNRFPDTDTTSYGLIARLDVSVDVPYGIYEALYKPPEPEPELDLALTPDDSLILADTTGRYFLTQLQRNSWIECRLREIQAAWEDTVLVPFRIDRANNNVARTDTAMAQLQRWLVQQKRDAGTRLAEAAGASIGVDYGVDDAAGYGDDTTFDETSNDTTFDETTDDAGYDDASTPDQSGTDDSFGGDNAGEDSPDVEPSDQ
jgi:tetratricopeptide (TPR) repeat protein